MTKLLNKRIVAIERNDHLRAQEIDLQIDKLQSLEKLEKGIEVCTCVCMRGSGGMSVHG